MSTHPMTSMWLRFSFAITISILGLSLMARFYPYYPEVFMEFAAAIAAVYIVFTAVFFSFRGILTEESTQSEESEESTEVNEAVEDGGESR